MADRAEKYIAAAVEKQVALGYARPNADVIADATRHAEKAINALWKLRRGE